MKNRLSGTRVEALKAINTAKQVRDDGTSGEEVAGDRGEGGLMRDIFRKQTRLDDGKGNGLDDFRFQNQAELPSSDLGTLERPRPEGDTGLWKDQSHRRTQGCRS